MLLSQFINHIQPGVDESSYVKAQLLNDICKQSITSPIFL